MDYNLLGDTGLFVSELGFGTMSFGCEGMWKSVCEQQQEEALIPFADTHDVSIAETVLAWVRH